LIQFNSNWVKLTQIAVAVVMVELSIGLQETEEMGLPLLLSWQN
jgi:hypothetical protein